MKQHLPFKPDNYASWAAPKLPPSIPTIASTTPSANPCVGGHSNTLIYIGLGVLTIAVIATAIYLVNQNNELSYQISAISSEIKQQSVIKAPEQTSNLLITDSKTKENETA